MVREASQPNSRSQVDGKVIFMKKTRFRSILAISVAAILTLMTLASCSSSKDNYAGLAPEMNMGSGSDVNLNLSDSAINKEEGEYERKIIKVANISAETKQFDDSISQLEALCQSAGGYIESSSIRGINLNSDGSTTSRYATYTIRIPSDKFDEFNSGVQSMLNIVSSSSNVEEVTNQYYDIKSRIEVLELQKESLQKMYDNFTDYKDIDTLLSLQDKLYSVIEEIEAYETQLRLYDNKVSYSTVHINITEVVDYTEIAEEKTFFREIKDAFMGGCEFALSLLQGIAIVIAAVTPVLLPLVILIGIAALIVFIIIKSATKKSKKKKNADK